MVGAKGGLFGDGVGLFGLFPKTVMAGPWPRSACPTILHTRNVVIDWMNSTLWIAEASSTFSWRCCSERASEQKRNDWPSEIVAFMIRLGASTFIVQSVKVWFFSSCNLLHRNEDGGENKNGFYLIEKRSTELSSAHEVSGHGSKLA